MDLDLLKAFLTVVEADSFTRAATRLALTQSTVSQQIRRLEEVVGQSLIVRQRAGRSVALTASGEILVPYARRLLDISAEARTMVAREKRQAVVRLGVTEDLSSNLLAHMLESCSSSMPEIRLEVTSAWGDALNRLQASGELDLALVKQRRGAAALSARPENATWVASPRFDADADVVPLALFPHGCLYRAQATEILTAHGRAWHVAFTGQGLAAVQAAVNAGLGAAILADDIVGAEMRKLGPSEGFPVLPPLDLALVAMKPLSVPGEAVASHLQELIFQP